MNAKKIIKGIVGLGVMGGVAYLAYKVGEGNGEINERFRDKYGDDEDDSDIEFDDDDEDYRFYDHMDEPDDGCIAPADINCSPNQQEYKDDRFAPIEIINISGITLGQLRGLLLHLTMLKNFHKKNVKEYLGIDDDIIIDLVIETFEINGYICKRDKYKYHAQTNIADCGRIIGW